MPTWPIVQTPHTISKISHHFVCEPVSVYAAQLHMLHVRVLVLLLVQYMQYGPDGYLLLHIP